ncbi:hypothetical protein K7432_005484 [Basidiobolus ranarum]|uniref:DNA (cytosine-5-)-methyltransferase n=1 Tax=Basidiobolus ranarum TaxID=34480 RepID=A0ABR2W331_9FUNG
MDGIKNTRTIQREYILESTKRSDEASSSVQENTYQEYSLDNKDSSLTSCVNPTNSPTTTPKDTISAEASKRKRTLLEEPVLVVIPKRDVSCRTVVTGEEAVIVKLLINSLSTEAVQESEEGYHECFLDDFTIYNKRGKVVELIDNVDCEVYFEGLLSVASNTLLQFKCQKGAFGIFSIGGYGTNISRPIIWVKSTVHDDTWYLLKSPSARYFKTWESFYWKAQFTKYIIDFVQEMPDRPFSDVQDLLYKWLYTTYKNDDYLEESMSRIREEDIGFMMATNGDFLLSQVLSLGEDFAQLPFFQNSRIGKKERASTKRKCLENTSVTPKVMSWFEGLFGHHIHKINIPTSLPNFKTEAMDMDIPLGSMSDQITRFDQEYLPLEIEWKEPISIEEGIYNEVVCGGLSIKIGDVVELYRKELTSWDSVGGRWIAQITQLLKDDEGGYYRMVWLYSRCQTVIEDIQIHPSKELFYTVFCQCDDYQSIGCIKRKCVVLFHSSTCPDIPHVYFCRFFYDHLNGCFWDLDREEISNSEQVLVCGCATFLDSVVSKAEIYDIKQYHVGDTLLIKPAQPNGLFIYSVCEVTQVDTTLNQLTVRFFINARETYTTNQPKMEEPAINELYYCNQLDILGITELYRIGGYCYVEYRKPNSPLSINLQHNGAGLQYFFSYRLQDRVITGIDSTIERRFLSYLQKNKDVEKLCVLDLFCGGGSFGRGLQDTGLFECRWAIDIDSMAAYTYKANARNDTTLVFNQSVNKFLENCVNGESDTPKKGEVDMILAGNPCQGYSSLNLDRFSELSQNSNSLLASLASFIEFYEPKYVLMENVRNFPRMTETVDGEKRSPFKILLAFLLSLGYQVRWSYISAVHHSCPQNRVRFFLWAAAKGEYLPPFPLSSHHGTDSRYSQTSIALPNTEKIPGVVNPEYACFPMRTVNNAIGDLPPIGEGHIMHSRFPDHKVIPLPHEQQILVNAIPLYPPGCDYRSLVGKKLPDGKAIVLPPWLSKKVERGTAPGTHFARVERDGLFQTITTRCSPSGFQGRVLHYQENRTLSVREVARGQGKVSTSARKESNTYSP